MKVEVVVVVVTTVLEREVMATDRGGGIGRGERCYWWRWRCPRVATSGDH